MIIQPGAFFIFMPPGLRIGSDYEFFSRPEWAALQEKYGLQFAGPVSMDSSLMYAALEAGEVDIITAFSTDGRIAAIDLVVLDDTRDAFPPYDAFGEPAGRPRRCVCFNCGRAPEKGACRQELAGTVS